MFRKDESNRLEECLTGTHLRLSPSPLTDEDRLQHRLNNVRRLNFWTCCRFTEPISSATTNRSRTDAKSKSESSADPPAELKNEVPQFCRFERNGTLNFEVVSVRRQFDQQYEN